MRRWTWISRWVVVPACLVALGCGTESTGGGGGGPEPSEGEGEGEQPGEGEGEGEQPAWSTDDGVWGTECTPGGDPCPGEGYGCMRVSEGGRAGTCLPRCGPVEVATCAQADCAEGHLCAHIDYSPVIVARNVCLPQCTTDDTSTCYTGYAACAPEIKVSDKMYFDCEDELGTSMYACVP